MLAADVCVILHNLIASMQKRGELDGEIDGSEGSAGVVDELHEEVPGVHGTAAPVGQCAGLPSLLERSDEVMSESGHVALRAALIDHLWSVRGESQLP